MAINRHLFQAAATIYQSFLESPLVMLPQDPEHANTAREIAMKLHQAAKGDPDVLLAASRILAGFHKNKQSAHCSADELVSLAVMGAQNLVNAFGMPSRPLAAIPSQVPVPQQQNVPFMPQQMPVPQAPPPAPAPTIATPQAPLSIPDFTADGQS